MAQSYMFQKQVYICNLTPSYYLSNYSQIILLHTNIQNILSTADILMENVTKTKIRIDVYSAVEITAS